MPDAGLGALTYALDFLTGVIGSRQRWRTIPWLVLLFGLVGAAMIAPIPYSLDENRDIP